MPEDIVREWITGISAGVLSILLQDKAAKRNIIWATSDYLHYGDDYAANSEIQPEQLTGTGGCVIQPRAFKTMDEQAGRTRRRAEVCTPAWICEKMCRVLFDDWADRPWQEQIDCKVLEITCGEAPFLTARYDAATGEAIPLQDRAGVLDYKLRLVGEHAKDEAEWLKWALRAVQSCYGFEYQGDSLLIARLNILLTYADHLRERWGREPTEKEQAKIANVIAWNLWQADGLTGATPTGSLEERAICQMSLFDDETGGAVPCVIYDWRSRETVLYANMEMRRGRKMRFDYAIGNPPYQDETIGENKGFAPPVYHLFLEEAYKVADKVEMIHPARFLFNAGSTPKEWNRKMLADPNYKILHFEQDASKIFSNTEIKGGVVISFRDKTREFGAIQIFTPYAELNTIMHKAAPSDAESDSLMNVIFVQNRFDLDALYRDYPAYKSIIGSEGKDKRFRNNIFDKIPLFTSEAVSNTDIPVIGVIKNKRVWRYIPSKYVDQEHENLGKWKVLVARVNGSGVLGDVLSSPIVTKPNTAYTQTFIGVGAFDTQSDAENCLKYIKSKFCRVMLGILKITQDNNRETWKMVPLQDFSSSSDIDWSKPIPDIDRQLYQKYGLSQEEIDFIETHVKEMV